MTEILVRYAGFDLILRADGDNDHHVVEDMAITFDRVLRHAMSDRPIERMTNRNCPPDDALVMSSLDLVDRPLRSIDCPDSLYTS